MRFATFKMCEKCMKAQALAERICQIKFHSGRKGVNLIAG